MEKSIDESDQKIREILGWVDGLPNKMAEAERNAKQRWEELKQVQEATRGSFIVMAIILGASLLLSLIDFFKHL